MTYQLIQRHKQDCRTPKEVINSLGLKELSQEPIYMSSPKNPDMIMKITPNELKILKPTEAGLVKYGTKPIISSYDIEIFKEIFFSVI